MEDTKIQREREAGITRSPVHVSGQKARIFLRPPPGILHESPAMTDIEVMLLEKLVQTGTGESGNAAGLGDVAG